MEALPAQECIALATIMFFTGLMVPFRYGMEKIRELGRYIVDGLTAFGKFLVDKLPPK